MAEYKINYTQSNFTGGIIAAELYGRNDFNKVKSGLKKCTNWTIREAGGLEFRRGTRYVQTIPSAAGANFKMASLDNQLLFFCFDGIRYLDSTNSWNLLPYSDWTVAEQDANLGDKSWSGVAYGDGKFVAIGFYGYISTSTDCVTWTSATQDANLDDAPGWTAIAYDGTKFLALSTNGYISTSTDGTTWTTPTKPSSLDLSLSVYWHDVIYDGNKFIALSTYGDIAVSTDGITWTRPTVLSYHQNSWNSLAYDGNTFIALNKAGYISTSTDGVTWTTAKPNVNLGNKDWNEIVYDGTKFVALDYHGYQSVSADGIAWFVATQDANLGDHDWTVLACDDNKVVALGYHGYISRCTNIVDVEKLHFTELKRRLYYYDGNIKLSEVVLNAGVPSTYITKFESKPTGITLTSSVSGNAPAVYVPVTHKYTFSLAKDEEHETVVSDLTTSQTANAELTQANSSDNAGQQVNVTVTLTADQATEYNGGKILIYKEYQGYFYFLSALDIVSGTTAYTFNDKGVVSVDMSKTPKTSPDYLQADGSITDVNSVADYNQRLFLTQSEQDVTRIIFSEAGNTESLAFSSQRNENEAGNLELPISHYDSWCKVVSGLDLILSTSYTISKVSGYGDLVTETVLWDGLSKTVDPVRTRRSLIYTNASNRNIYDLTYNEYGQYDSIDLTLLVKYIFEEKTIKRLAFKDYPVKTIYVLCSDGELYCLTYIKEQNIYAWYKIEHEGTIVDICVINTDVEDEVFVVVKYGDNFVVERVYHRTDDVYMDCCVTKQLSDITIDNKITGLNIFEGKKVRVFDSGNNFYYGDYDIMNPKTVVEGGKTVEIDDLDFDGFLVENGKIQLPDDVEFVGPLLIGLPYYAVAETIPLEFADQNGNSTIGRKKAVNEAYLRYGDSRGVSYKTMGHEYDCGICERDIADNAQFLERGQVKLHTVSEYKWDSTIKMLQRQPYPARIESITLGITFNDKS